MSLDSGFTPGRDSFFYDFMLLIAFNRLQIASDSLQIASDSLQILFDSLQMASDCPDFNRPQGKKSLFESRFPISPD